MEQLQLIPAGQHPHEDSKGRAGSPSPVGRRGEAPGNSHLRLRYGVFLTAVEMVLQTFLSNIDLLLF